MARSASGDEPSDEPSDSTDTLTVSCCWRWCLMAALLASSTTALAKHWPRLGRRRWRHRHWLSRLAAIVG
eukprot:3354166-Prymnesium_polylepis.1